MYLEWQQKDPKETREKGVSHVWIKVTSELNVRAAELSLNFWIMRNYVHGNLCTWLRNSYEWEGWCGDELLVCLPPCSHYMPAFTSDRCCFIQEKKSLEYSFIIEPVWRVLCFSDTCMPEKSGCFNKFLKSILHVIFKHSTKSTRLWNQFAIVQFNSSILWCRLAHKNLLIRLGCVRGQLLAWII